MEEYTVVQPEMAIEEQSPWSKINPIICGRERSVSGENEESSKGGDPGSTTHVDPCANDNCQGKERTEDRNDPLLLHISASTNKHGLLNSFGIPADGRDDDVLKSAALCNVSQDRDRVESQKSPPGQNETSGKGDYIPTGLSDLSSVDEYPAAPATRMGPHGSAFGSRKSAKEEFKCEIKTEA